MVTSYTNQLHLTHPLALLFFVSPSSFRWCCPQQSTLFDSYVLLFLVSPSSSRWCCPQRSTLFDSYDILFFVSPSSSRWCCPQQSTLFDSYDILFFVSPSSSRWCCLQRSTSTVRFSLFQKICSCTTIPNTAGGRDGSTRQKGVSSAQQLSFIGNKITFIDPHDLQTKAVISENTSFLSESVNDKNILVQQNRH